MTAISELFERGLSLHQSGHLRQAETLYRQILQVEPNHAAASQALGLLAHQTGKYEAAAELIRRAIDLSPSDANWHFNLGVVLTSQGRLTEAIGSYRRALALNPNHSQAHNNLGIALQNQGALQEASECFRLSLRCNPSNANASFNLGNLLADQGQLAEAIGCYRHALRIDPGHASALNNRGRVLRKLGEFGEAIDCYQQALKYSENAGTYLNLGNALKDQGQLAEAVACFRRAVQMMPDYVEAASNVLTTIHFCPDYDAATLSEEHRDWSRRHAEPLARLIPPHANQPAPDRRLRIGYISPDFRDHVLACSFVPLFSAHDHERYEIFFYADVPHPDSLTARLRTYADVSRSIVGLSDEQVAQRILQDEIDILVDLTMHMARHRLLVFARKPAPIQVTWGAYPGTTGLPTIDYRLTNAYLDPPGADVGLYAESSVRLPDSFWCYDPLTDEPAVNPLPALANGFVTFGCFNNFCKVNEGTLRTWGQVLRAIPSARLVLLAPEGHARAFTLKVLAQEGVAAERVTFVSRRPARRQYLEFYQTVDIGFDTLPYNGHTTSIDSYWMGVPVVTLVGQTIVGRAGVSQLHNLGLQELIAESPEQLVRLLVKLAGDLPRLEHLRTTLRERLQASPLMDGRRFARNVEGAFRDMWRRWCADRR
jgi:predicted O-linked N-acetylglucosamine transferase (SPINDLY family)